MMPVKLARLRVSRRQIVISASIVLSVVCSSPIVWAAYDAQGRYYYNPRTKQWYAASPWRVLGDNFRSTNAYRWGNQAAEGVTHVGREIFDPNYPCKLGWKQQGHGCVRVKSIAFNAVPPALAAPAAPVSFTSHQVANYQSPPLPQSVSRSVVPNQGRTIILSRDPATRNAQVAAVIQAAHRQ